MKKNCIIVVPLFFLLFALSCTFDYGESDSSDDNSPDLVMDNVVYIRVRSADPIARFQAERAERYEKKRIMELLNFTFEQYGEHGEEVNAYGRAGSASVDIDSGDIKMKNSVRIEVESEDIIIETFSLEWKDKEKTISTEPEDIVYIFQENGTNFTGIGLFADARKRTYEFYNEVSGVYIHDDDEEEETDTPEINSDSDSSETGDIE
jgi:LPS export ABC transporter protein LptC